MITITFIRHGQSEDNPRGIWAGWKDAPLSELSVRQAKALGEHLSTTKIDLIYSSPLLRARQTGEAVQSGQSVQPMLITNPHLREQHWGIAEGRSWSSHDPQNMPLEEAFNVGVFTRTVLIDGDGKFPGGESRNDLAARADIAVKECILPNLTEENFENGLHIAFTSHGLCIGQLIAALLRYDASADGDISYEGLGNTAWTRVEVFLDANDGPVDLSVRPALKINVTHINAKEHLECLDQPDVLPDGRREKETAEFLSGGAIIAKY
ncbi:phosphoglycerate mutase-like protein [Guyanagaster necrorhizus]|uniref:Phosphoglycerate mutase-like protein n=1 Tax=Guyanagaster necrorhizus TaxID=856835 RepID=A0A9P7VYN9_9AGAR|nr:phosphoglycerate mutase-like protein [Guyanagaster necrorhizus MCA 3950]KAG7448875.1 phosphoglycerate mutase-like protein [Guyanagaster necrorhizus MCA 3950]